MSDGMDKAGSASGASTPTSPNFDPGASEFVPNRTPATDGRTASGQLRTAFHTAPSSSGRKFVRPGLPLFTSNTWAPTFDPPRSAGIAPKPSWEGLAGRNSALNAAQTRTSPTHGFNAGTPQAQLPTTPLSGRLPSNNNSTGGGGIAFADQSSPGPSNIRFTQTAEYHNSAPNPSPSSATPGSLPTRAAPLPPLQFDQFRPIQNGPTSSSGGSSASQQAPVPGTPNSSTSSFATQPFPEQNFSEDQMSPSSGSVAISEHYSKKHPEQAGSKGEVWTERHSTKSLRRALKDPNAEWEEAYPGALSILTCMNPEAYQMPYGTRVINVKTEYPRNVLLSLKYGKYAVMQKVAERIMKVWNSREDSTEKVLFLFSVNGSKKYCGVAEMSGPWEENGHIPNWEHNPESDPCVGTIPCIWIFVKDVSYHQFIHLKQPNNGNPVGNMWNGMNFPSETGREVLEIYVKSPATSSILGHPRCQENEGLPPATTYTRRGGFNSRSNRGGRGDFRGGSRGGHATSQHWRQRNASDRRASEADFDADQTPTAGTQSGQRYPVSRNGPPPKFNPPVCDAPSPSPLIKPGQLLSVIVNDQGKLELVGVDAKQTNSSEPAEDGNNSARAGRGGMRGVLHGARSLSSLHRSSSSTSTLRAQNDSGTHRLHPAVSMDSIGQVQGQAVSRRGLISPLSATWTNGNSGHHDALRSPEATYGADVGTNGGFGAASGVGADTPTHRPAHHSSRRGENAAVKGLEVARPSLNLLKARFHSIAAEQYSTQAQLDQPEINEINSRVLNAKIARILVEKRELQAELAMMGVHPEMLSPMRHDSFSSTEPESASSSSVHQISPVRAEDGRRLRSISKLDSPLTTKDSGAFDKAPGGSDRIKRHKANDSWDLQIKSVAELVDSPKKASTPARPATSTFFPDDIISPCERRVLSFPTPRGFDNSNKPASPLGQQSASFPTDLTQVSDKSSSTSGQDDASGAAGHGGVRLDS